MSMEKELVAVVKDLLLLLGEHGLENLRHPAATGGLAIKKKGETPHARGCRFLEKYREEQVRKSQEEAKAVIEKVKLKP